MKIYSKTGDKGETSVIGGKRVPKHHPRIEAYGTVDELIAWIGMLRSYDHHSLPVSDLISIQEALMSCSAVIAAPPPATVDVSISEEDLKILENRIDDFNSRLPALTAFILPGGDPAASAANIARTVCRRAERTVINLDHTEKTDDVIIKYLNRLSDYLFMLTRLLMHDSDTEEIKWPQE